MTEQQKIWMVHIFFDIPVLLICARILIREYWKK